jgi:hypothetical protein
MVFVLVFLDVRPRGLRQRDRNAAGCDEIRGSQHHGKKNQHDVDERDDIERRNGLFIHGRSPIGA